MKRSGLYTEGSGNTSGRFMLKAGDNINISPSMNKDNQNYLSTDHGRVLAREHAIYLLAHNSLWKWKEQRLDAWQRWGEGTCEGPRAPLCVGNASYWGHHSKSCHQIRSSLPRDEQIHRYEFVEWYLQEKERILSLNANLLLFQDGRQELFFVLQQKKSRPGARYRRSMLSGKQQSNHQAWRQYTYVVVVNAFPSFQQDAAYLLLVHLLT